MSINEIQSQIHAIILQSISNPGLDLETNKLDFKSGWYDLKDEKQINEFLKDSTAIVNSYGGADGFIIIGFDPRSSKFHDSEFVHSKLRDKSDLSGLIGSKVDRPFNIDEIPYSYEGHRISILHFPPSLDKPHIIRRYVSDKGYEFENEIFVRHATGAKRAKKYDLDLMYAEKRSIVIERQVDASFSISRHLSFSKESENRIRMDGHIIFENYGIRKIAIMQIVLQMMIKNEGKDWKRIDFVNDPGLSNMKVLDVDEIFIYSKGLHLSTALQVDPLLKLLKESTGDSNYLSFVGVYIITASGEEFSCRLNIVK